jgi:hypothetical protein
MNWVPQEHKWDVLPIEPECSVLLWVAWNIPDTSSCIWL